MSHAAQRTTAAIVVMVAVPMLALFVPGLVRAASHAVELRDHSFTPSDLTVAAGDTVTWTNNGGFIHDVESLDGAPAAFSSGNMITGATFTFTFTEAGTYDYLCQFHDQIMRGSVTVEAGPVPNTATAPGSAVGLTLAMVGALLVVAGITGGMLVSRSERRR